ncbi:MAG: Acetyltransferase (GNAT) family protein [Methanoregulaceae archaeon PtaB.Bin009]|jgi:ribosomal protein S18 acetylase RimI-like enzyme|nr:MAG: Acetyltransferase (GNAT) family protein [Methanoregulaceae archaeon PtaB.Bin009]OPY40687.1 MAG: Acetyltransferase (GNAT) family protein [Methanoregulaceae archaeon PtaU1.Bin066]HNQ30305.1 GNAT family N-acetyltransferase [Methanolinea sp.]
MTGTNRSARTRAGPKLPGASLHPLSLSVVPLVKADAEAAAELYTRVFLDDEPTTRCHGLAPARFLPFARCYVRWLVEKDLSFVAKDERTGEALGFIFCFDFRDDPAQDSPVLREFLQQFRHAIAMIDELEARHICRDEIEPGSILHIFQIGVDRKGRRQGIARGLINRVLSHANERGFLQMVADCTNPASRRLFEACGFSEVGISSYESFTIDGRCIFDGLEGGISLMIRDVSPRTLLPFS